MYEITCETCSQIGVHPSRTGAETRAEVHKRETSHDCAILTMTDV